MKNNIFEEIYEKITKAKTEKEVNKANALYQAAENKLMYLNEAEKILWRAYETSRDCKNKYLDINDNIKNEIIEDLVASMRRLGFIEFTFSSTWNNAVETAWLFQKTGCTLAGIIEINGSRKDFETKKYVKIHAYLFKLN